jgi:hypothetical protein
MPLDLNKIGRVLKAAREEKNLTTGKVSENLLVRKRVIEAIEEGKSENLPHEVYIRGYVTQYASFLGILDEIKSELISKGDRNTAVPEAPRKVYPKTSAHRVTKKRIVGFGTLALIVGGFFILQNVEKPVLVVPPPAQPVEAGYQTVSATAQEGQTDKVVFEAKKLMIACQQRTWVRIVIDGSEKREFMMNPEEVVVLNGKESFDLLIGNAGGVRLFYNGKDTGFRGEEGEVKRISLS